MTPRHFLVAGAQRCGTTYLRTLLAEHPGIAMAEPARPEPKVLLDPEQVALGADHYRATWFGHAGPGQLLGDKSTSYLDSADAAGRARDLLGEPLVVVQLRDPVERALSHWAFSTEHGLEERPVAEVLEANLAGPLPWDASQTSTSTSPYAYLERGRYLDVLRPWIAVHGERLRVQLLDDLDAGATGIAATYAWLGVDPTFTPLSGGLRVNASVCAGLASSSWLGLELTARLREYFADADAGLSQLLGRELPWRR